MNGIAASALVDKYSRYIYESEENLNILVSDKLFAPDAYLKVGPRFTYRDKYNIDSMMNECYKEIIDQCVYDGDVYFNSFKLLTEAYSGDWRKALAVIYLKSMEDKQ